MICSLYLSLTQSAPRLQVETEDYLMMLFGILPIDCHLQVFYSKLVNYGSPRLGPGYKFRKKPCCRRRVERLSVASLMLMLPTGTVSDGGVPALPH